MFKYKYLASGSVGFRMSECAIKIWDLASGHIVKTLSFHWEEVSTLMFSQSNYLNLETRTPAF